MCNTLKQSIKQNYATPTPELRFIYKEIVAKNQKSYEFVGNDYNSEQYVIY